VPDWALEWAVFLGGLERKLVQADAAAPYNT